MANTTLVRCWATDQENSTKAISRLPGKRDATHCGLLCFFLAGRGTRLTKVECYGLDVEEFLDMCHGRIRVLGRSSCSRRTATAGSVT